MAATGVWLMRDGTDPNAIVAPQPVERPVLDGLIQTCESWTVTKPLHPILAERRGERFTLLLGDAAEETNTRCILYASGELISIGGSQSRLPAPGKYLERGHITAKGGRDGTFHHCAGRALPPAAAVTFALADGRTAVATVANGWFLIVWPSGAGDAEAGAVVYDAAGKELERIDRSVCGF